MNVRGAQNLPDLSRLVHRFAEKQGGHVTRPQALTVMGERTLARWLEKGRLIRVHTGVYAVGHLPTNPFDRAHAALLAGGDGCALAGESAMVLWQGLRRPPHAP